MIRVIGFDPSLTSYGLSDGERHVRIKTTPVMGSTYHRVQHIFAEINGFVGTVPADSFLFVVEGPSYGSAMMAGASAQFDAGYLMCRFDQLARQYGATPHVIQPTTLKKFVTGRGNAKKAEMPLAVFKKWKMEFADDPGGDKLHAYCLFRLGEAMLAGKFVAPIAKPRGTAAAAQREKKRAKAMAV
jgi:Holliday junction resolvasome RuvABC endonuclease subunit